MKRIRYACLEQTIRFILKDDIPHNEAVEMTRRELDSYKARLEHSRTKYRIISETTESDGSITLKLKKQYNGYNCGDYLN